jgi:hypothetical protein
MFQAHLQREKENPFSNPWIRGDQWCRKADLQPLRDVLKVMHDNSVAPEPLTWDEIEKGEIPPVLGGHIPYVTDELMGAHRLYDLTLLKNYLIPNCIKGGILENMCDDVNSSAYHRINKYSLEVLKKRLGLTKLEVTSYEVEVEGGDLKVVEAEDDDEDDVDDDEDVDVVGGTAA